MLPNDEQIRRRAYEIWEREGRPEGRESEHWRMAVEELTAARSARQEVPAQRVRGPAQLDETSPAPSGNAGSLSQPGPGDTGNVPAATDPQKDPLGLAQPANKAAPRKRSSSSRGSKRARQNSPTPPETGPKIPDRSH
jgi:hypothetical protein